MSSREVIDISDHAKALRQRRNRRLLRLMVPIFCLLVMIGAIAGIAAYSYTQNRGDALALSDQLVQSLNDRITARVATYLAPVSEMVKLSAGVLNDIAFEADRRSRAETLAVQIFDSYPQIVAFNLGEPNGNFLMVKKMEDGAFHTKTIEQTGDQLLATWFRRDTAGNVVEVEKTGNDSYDPRSRPWYTGALETAGVYWTDVYIFFTDQKPGVTAATAVYGPEGEIQGVLSLDVLLEQLSRFLAELNIGSNGRALLIEANGRLVAMAEMDRLLQREGDGLRPAMVEELGDPVWTRAFNRFRIEGHGIRHITVDNRSIISMAAPLLSAGGRNWSVLMAVPEDDFVGFVKRNAGRSLLMSTGVVGLATILFGLLVWQGLKADRNAQMVLENRRRFELQSRAFSELTDEGVFFGPKDAESMERLTEIAGRAVGVRRTSVWRASDMEAVLICEDAFDQESGGHTQGTLLHRHEFPDLFEAVFQGRELVLSDAGNDTRTAELHRVYLSPLGCHALLCLPVRASSETIGALWFEGQSLSRTWSSEETIFARAIAGLLALRFEIGKKSGPETCPQGEIYGQTIRTLGNPNAPPAAGAEPFTPSPDGIPAGLIAGGRTNRFFERVAARGLNPDRLAVDVFPNVTVLVLRLTNTLALAERTGGEKQAAAIAHLVDHLETLASVHGLDYLKIMSDEVICAAGFGDHTGTSYNAIADLALDLQDKCRQLFSDLNTPMDFRIGVDTGPVIGSAVGEKRDYYNLWGDAVRTASMLADAGVPGGIQLSGFSYERLRAGYLFKRRGAFYVEDTGEIDTYLLTGRL